MAVDEEDPDRLAPHEVETALSQMDGADWARAERMARALVCGVHEITSEDLLQEALTKLLSGERRFPRSSHPLVVLKTAMHSEASNLRRRAIKGPIDGHVTVTADYDDELDEPFGPQVEAVDSRTPEDAVVAKDQLEYIYKCLEGDEELELVAMAWADGLRGQDAADAAGLDMKAYDAARKRLDRKLSSPALGRREA
ncbi:hypothetical protein [Zoogloea sp.]|uniref:RNA polymerase sigma factor n=1 Tax=Zoogloea sp. TaxID=49181 RepID=UPI001AD3284E|nr:hypothetical protein [Zoogloea sp.]MBN8282764.1 hypothetical protein [Zoogloea sp.]